MKLEVIATSLADVKIINQSNADRIEFCDHLEVGGLTPTYREILEVTSESTIPVNVMVRPTNRDFYYTDDEFIQMLEDVKYIASTKANGIVIGILNPDQTINMERMRQVMSLKGDKQVTFHRAFEQLKDPIASLAQLKELGIDSVLTSGNGDINNSFDLLAMLKEAHKATIIGGSGINLSNVEAISKVVNEIHVGTAIRHNYSWTEPIDLNAIAQFKELLINKK